MTTGVEPDDPPPPSWVTLTVWIGGGSLSVGIYALILWAIISLAGCATGYVGNDGELHGFAIGEGAKLERCASFPVGEPALWGLKDAPINTTCTRIEGGPILPSILDIVGSAIGGAAKFVISLWGPAI